MSLGRKAENLFVLADYGLEVPLFYAISAKEASSKVFSSKLLKQFRKWKKENGIGAVAIRSSSAMEDSASISFAGQFKTVLGVKSDEAFLNAISEVSQFQIESKYAIASTKINVIVQQYIEPDFAGVAFTANPASGKSELVLNFTAGSGEKTVGGEDVNQYFIDRYSSQILGKTISLPDEDLISNKHITQIRNAALKIEGIFGEVQDIEWAIKNNILYTLQSRPITNLSHLRVWDSSNLSESFPGIVRPLTFSVARRGYNLVYKSQAYAAGLNWYQLEENHRAFDSMVGIFQGKMYYNLISWYKFISLFPANKSNQKFLDQQLATVGDAVYMPSSRHSLKYKVMFWIRIFRRTVFFKRELNKFYEIYNKTFDELNAMPQSPNVNFLMQKFELIESRLIPHFGRTVDNDFFVMTFHGLLKKLLDKWGVKLKDSNNFQGSMQNVVSADQALILYSISSQINDDKKALELLTAKKYEQLDKYLFGTEIEKLINKYKDEFGHRFAEDQKIEAINPLLTPSGLYEFIALYTKLDSSKISKRLASANANNKINENEISNQLSPIKRRVYRILLKRIKKHLRIREKNRLLRGRVYAYMREIFPEIGKSLAERDQIEKWQDIYYLEIEEIYQLLHGALIVNNLKSRISERRTAYTKYDKANLPERFISIDIPILADIPKPRKVTNHTNQLSGLISSPGTITGKAIVLTKPKIPEEPFDILVVNHTDPGWTPLIALAKGVVVEHGGMLSHAAIITRELGIPSIIGVEGATDLISNGDKITISTEKSVVEIQK